MRAQASCTMPEKVLDVALPAGDHAAAVVEPGKEPFDLPAALRAAQRPAVLGLRAAATIRGDHLDAVLRHAAGRRVRRCRSRGRRSVAHGRSGRKRASRVAGTRCGSYGEALATCTATGRPWRSQIAMTLVPLPRRVGPIAAPLFSPRRRSRRRRLHSDRSCRGPGGPRRGVAAADRGGPSAARAGSDDGRFGTADSATAGRATARPCAGPTARRSSPPADRSTAGRAHRGDGADGRSVRARPIGRRSGPCRRVRRRSYRCFPLMQPGCQGNCSLRCGRQNGHAPSTSNRPPTTMNTRVTEKPARKCGRV